MLSALFLSVANLLQSRGVEHVSAANPGTLGAGQFFRLLRNVSWVIGAVLLGIAILLQLGSLTFAPLIVVQPVGVTALVFAALLTTVFTRRLPTRAVTLAIVTCVVSVTAFVTVAASVSTQTTIDSGQLIAVLVCLAVTLVVALAVFLLSRRNGVPPVLYVILGGVFSGFVATLGKTVILRIQTALHSDDFTLDPSNILTIFCLLGIAVAGGLSIYFVQAAHAANRPETVVAGLTVIDPFVAVILGVTVLDEAHGAPLWAYAAFAVAGALAVWGVLSLSRAKQAEERAFRRQST